MLLAKTSLDLIILIVHCCISLQQKGKEKMNKLFSKVAALSVGLAMAIGVGVAVGSKSVREARADDVVSYTLDGSIAGTGSNYGSNNTATQGGITWKINGNLTTNPWRIGGNSLSGVDRVAYSQQAVSGTITKVDLTVGAASSITVNSLSLIVASDASFSSVVETVNKTFAANSTITFSATETWEDCFYKFVFNVTVSGSTNRFIQFKSAEFYTDSSLIKEMKIKLNDATEGPFEINYSSTGYLFYAKDGSTQLDANWSVGDSSILSVEENSNHVAVVTTLKPGTTTLSATADGYLPASVNITVKSGDLQSVTVSGSMSRTNYATGSAWEKDGLIATANYSTGYALNVTDLATWSYSPASASSTSITSVVATATYESKSDSTEAQAVSIYNGAAFQFEKNWENYKSKLGGYGAVTLAGVADLASDKEASIAFTYVSKQEGTITTMPVIAAKSGQESTMIFVLDSEVSESFTITSVEVSFVRWAANKKVGAALYKGTSVSGEPIDSFSKDDAPKSLVASNLNGDSFIVNFTTTETSNQQLGVKAIYIGLEAKQAYGKTDHIKVTSFPRTVYHVGEKYDATGLVVTAYDGAEEATANYKDVTSEVLTGYTSGIYTFTDANVPTCNMFVEYTDEDSDVFYADDIVFHVYAVAEYELVTSEPTDWSGSYLLVSSYTDGDENDHTVAINSALVSFDQPANFIEVSPNGSKISAGQECEFTVKSYNDGYSAQGKNGKYAYGSSAFRFQTSDSEQKLSFAFESESNIVTITGAASYNMKLTVAQDNIRFGFYKDGVSNIKLYKLTASATANQFAQTFMGAFTCDSTGANKPSFNIKEGETKWTWALLASAYNALSASDKELFRLGAASSAEGASDIAKALARYDYIVGKYFVTGRDTSFTDFMERSPAPVTTGAYMNFNNILSSDSTMIIVISIATVSALAFTMFLVFKKKKQK